jgi:hypothetical protein
MAYFKDQRSAQDEHAMLFPATVGRIDMSSITKKDVKVKAATIKPTLPSTVALSFAS